MFANGIEDKFIYFAIFLVLIFNRILIFHFENSQTCLLICIVNVSLIFLSVICGSKTEFITSVTRCYLKVIYLCTHILQILSAC